MQKQSKHNLLGNDMTTANVTEHLPCFQVQSIATYEMDGPLTEYKVTLEIDEREISLFVRARTQEAAFAMLEAFSQNIKGMDDDTYVNFRAGNRTFYRFHMRSSDDGVLVRAFTADRTATNTLKKVDEMQYVINPNVHEDLQRYANECCSVPSTDTPSTNPDLGPDGIRLYFTEVDEDDTSEIETRLYVEEAVDGADSVYGTPGGSEYEWGSE